jgi:hypothetical protein
MIDIKKLLTEHGIFWRDKGEGVAKGNINIKCPWCEKEDPSEHLGIRLSDGYYGCWRDEKHRGKNLYKLLAVLGIYIVEEKSDTVSSLANRTYFNKIKETKEEIREVKATKLPDSFIPLDDSIFSAPYLTYLKCRGFDEPMRLAKDYDLRRSIINDKWQRRLIFPIWIEDEVCWTARAIGNSELRYLSSSKSEARNIKSCISNYNELKLNGGETLCIVEGPVDFLKIDYYLKPEVRATCLFGLSFIESQLQLLEQVCYNFNNILIGLDQGALPQALTLLKRFRKFSPIIMQVPGHDFGEMKPKAIKETIDKYL